MSIANPEKLEKRSDSENNSFRYGGFVGDIHVIEKTYSLVI